MTMRSHTNSTGTASESAQAFAGLGAGLVFFQDWMKAAGAAMPGMRSQGAAPMPGVPSWSVPTLDPEELDKRIQELKTVQFWLEQNSRMIAMTIQGMEVQKMTLSTLQGMNVSMDALRESLTAKVEPEAPTPPQSQQATAPSEDPVPQKDMINPMQWWDALTQQFSQLATQASQTAQTMGQTVEATMQDMVAQAQAAAPASKQPETPTKPGKATARTSAGAKQPTARKQAARSPARKSASKN